MAELNNKAPQQRFCRGAQRPRSRQALGQRTFGKGSVQNIINLSDGGGLKLTIARYHTQWSLYRGTGIEPHRHLVEYRALTVSSMSCLVLHDGGPMPQSDSKIHTKWRDARWRLWPNDLISPASTSSVAALHADPWRMHRIEVQCLRWERGETTTLSASMNSSMRLCFREARGPTDRC